MLILTVISILLQYRLLFGHSGLPSVLRLHRAIKIQLIDNTILEKRNQILAAEVQDLKNGLDALEERARSKLGMIIQGETFFQIIEDKDGE